MNTEQLQKRIAKTEELIEKWEDASIALSNGIQSHTIDTGQTRTTVTKADAGTVNRILEQLYSRLTKFQNRLDGSGTVIVRPGY